MSLHGFVPVPRPVAVRSCCITVWYPPASLSSLFHRWLFFFFFGHVLLLVGSWFPCQGSNPCPLPWKPGVLTDREFVHLLLNCVLPLPLTFYESSFFLCWKNPETCFTIIGIIFVVQLLSHVRFFVTPWAVACQASLSFTISQTLLKLMSIKSVIPFNHLILCCPLLLPSILPSIRVFPDDSVLCIRWPKYWNFSISPPNEYLGLIFFSIDWFDLLAVQGTLKSLLQHHSWTASVLRPSAFFIVQLSHPYMTTGKTIALTRWAFVGKVMSLLFNMLSRLVIAFI